MALAYPGQAIDQGSSPRGSDGTIAGPGSPSSNRSRPRTVDLVAIAQEFTPWAVGMTELRGLNRRSWILLAVTDLFEAWAIGWPPGGRIDLHDHGPSSGAIAVAAGTLTEMSVRVSHDGPSVIGTRHIRAGEHREFGVGHIHDLVNSGSIDALSVHVYGPRLSRMGYFQLDRRGELRQVRFEEIAPVGPFDITRDHAPS